MKSKLSPSLSTILSRSWSALRHSLNCVGTVLITERRIGTQTAVMRSGTPTEATGQDAVVMIWRGILIFPKNRSVRDQFIYAQKNQEILLWNMFRRE